jgi:hypothetical protein
VVRLSESERVTFTTQKYLGRRAPAGLFFARRSAPLTFFPRPPATWLSLLLLLLPLISNAPRCDHVSDEEIRQIAGGPCPSTWHRRMITLLITFSRLHYPGSGAQSVAAGKIAVGRDDDHPTVAFAPESAAPMSCQFSCTCSYAFWPDWQMWAPGRWRPSIHGNGHLRAPSPLRGFGILAFLAKSRSVRLPHPTRHRPRCRDSGRGGQPRHLPLRSVSWEPETAAEAINEIVADALARYDGERFWPAHPLDEGLKDSHSSIYFGAAGVIWALEYLRREGATEARFDFRPILSQLLANTRAEMAAYEYSDHGSLLLGDMGTALLIMRLAPEPAIADIVYDRASANTQLPVRELMWGLPGSMLACLSLAEMTGETRWRTLFEVQAERLVADLQETDEGPIWVQALYASAAKISRARSRICREYDPTDAPMGLADGEPAGAHCRCCAAHPEQKCLADRCWNVMACDHSARQTAVVVSALPRRSRHGHDVRRCPIHVA